MKQPTAGRQQIVCVWIPDWPIQRLTVEQTQLREQPFFIFGRPGRQKRQVLFCNAAAREQAIRVGMPLVEVPRTFAGPSFEYDPAADRQGLLELLPDCHKFSPWVGIDSTDATRENNDSLFLDISRTCSVLGGLAAVLHDLQIHFQQQGLQVKSRVGESLAAAWALAHYDEQNAVDWTIALAKLPITSLQIDAQSILTFRELGIETVGQVLKLPRASLPSRFGELLNRRIGQLLGHIEERIQVYHPPVDLQWTHRLEHASGDAEVLQTIACLLLRQAIEKLKPRRQGILSLLCQFQSGNRTMDFRLQLVEPSVDLEYLLQLLNLQFERQQIHTPQDSVQLSILLVGDNPARQQWLFEDQRDTRRQQRAGLVERLAARLGDASVQQLRQQSQALPERNYVRRKRMTLQKPLDDPNKNRKRNRKQKTNPQNDNQASEMSADTSLDTPVVHSLPSTLERPARLYPIPKLLHPVGSQRFQLSQGSGAWVPESFQFTKITYTVVYATGPERVESQWWEGQWVRRDYFRIQTDSGQRFWIFRQAKDRRWYVHGDFA